MAYLPPLVRPVLRIALVLLALMLGLGFAQQPAWASERTYRVVGVDYDDVLNIRAGPSGGAPIVGEIPPKARGVQLVGPCHGWCPVRYRGASGWVHARFLAAEPATARAPDKSPAPEKVTKAEKAEKPAAKSALPSKSEEPAAAAAPAAPNAVAAAPPAPPEPTQRIMSVSPAEPKASPPPAPPPAAAAPAKPVASAPPPSAPAPPVPPAAQAPVPKHWRVTGVAANAVLMVRSGPRDEAPVVFVYSPRATCIVYLGNCQKPWCQVQYPSDQGPRTGWVDARFLTPSNESCGG